MRCRLFVIALSAVWLGLTADASIARGDGGAVRFSRRIGNRLVTVFTSPTPVCVGPIDISLLVQDADSGTPQLDDPIEVQIAPRDRPSERTIAPATSAAATNKLLRAARLEISEPGPWRVEILMPSASAGPPIGFEMDVAAAPAAIPDLALWIGWPLAAIVLFAIHQWLVFRSHAPLLDRRRE